MSDLSWLNPTPHAIAVYASQPLSPVATQHSIPSGRYSLTWAGLPPAGSHQLAAGALIRSPRRRFGLCLPGGCAILTQHGRNIYLWSASTRRMVATRLSNSIGLASNSSHPVAMAFSRSPSSACADMPMIWNVPGLRIVLETPHGFPTIVVRHFEVHQDHVRVLARGQTAALLAVLRCDNL